MSAIETVNQRVERLRDLRVRLKSGEYDGVDIMHAWMAISDYADLLEQQSEELRPPPNTRPVQD